MTKSGFLVLLQSQPNPTPSLFSSKSGSDWPQQANSCVTICQTSHVCSDAQAYGRMAEIAIAVNIVGVKVGVTLMALKLVTYKQLFE